MFFFGFLSSTVPYIIIACLYAIGFGLYSGNKLKDRLVVDNEHALIQDYTKKTNQDFLKQKQDFFYGKNISKYNFLKRPLTPKNDFFLLPQESNRFKELQQDFQSDKISYKLFSRPPPIFV